MRVGNNPPANRHTTHRSGNRGANRRDSSHLQGRVQQASSQALQQAPNQTHRTHSARRTARHTPSNPLANLDSKHKIQAQTGAGVLPYYIENGEVYFLIGKERHQQTNYLWSDFGGKSDRNEVVIETAARECEEETRGILGPKAKIMETLAKCDYIFHKGYAMYLMPIDPAKVNFNDFYANRNWKECQKEKTELAVVKADHLFRTVDFYQTQGGRGIWLSGNSDRQILRRPFVECLSTAIEKHGSSQNLINSLPKI